MKTPIKITLAATFALAMAATSLKADDVKIIQIYNNHGGSALVYQRVEQPATVAVYAGNGSVGQRYTQDTVRNQQLRLTFRPNHHGSERMLYVAE